MLDVSGSMDAPASVEQAESDSFSVLDLVKHSVKSLLQVLSPEDFLCLIEFDSKADIIYPFQQLTEEAKTAATEVIENMKAKGDTNIWSALQLALKVMDSNPVCHGLNTSLWLFTDGESLEPPKGIMFELKRLLSDKHLDFTMNTFGFGYDMDSKLLSNLAEFGSGVFCYIPDCNIIGTTFINCLANTLAASIHQSWIELKGEDIPSFTAIGYPMAKNCVSVGILQYGQSRDFLFRFPLPPKSDFKIEVALHFRGMTITRTIEGLKAPDPLPIYRALCRAKYCEILDPVLKQWPTQPSDWSFLEKIQDFLTSAPCKDEPEMKALLRDIVSEDPVEGRVSKAFTTIARMNRWGQHYVRSIVRAHKMQQCHNFKDPGVQVYGGKLFKELQMQGEKAFCSLPATKPSRIAHESKTLAQDLPSAVSVSVPSSSSLPPAPVIVPVVNTMDMYMDTGGGCFDGEGEVRLVDGTVKKVKDVLYREG